MLYIWMPETNGTWYWSAGENWLQADSLEQLIQDLHEHHGKEAVVYFPSRNAQLLQQTMTKAHYKQLGQEGVKYLLEEFVTLPIDHMKVVHHFQNDQLNILGVAQSTIETWQHALSLLPIQIVAFLPDFLILPEPEPNQVVLLNLYDHLLVRENTWIGNSVDDLGLFLEFQAAATPYKFANLNASQLDSLATASSKDERIEFSYQFEQLVRPKQHPFNVLPKSKNAEIKWSGYWKAAAAVLLAVIIVQLGYDALRWSKLKSVADQTASQAIEQYKYWFGENSRVTEQNIKSQFESQLRMSQLGDTQALSLLSRVGPILMQKQIVAQQVSYDASVLAMSLKAKSADDLQGLTQQLNQQGFQAELGNVQADTVGAIGVVKVK
ncbi:type II secretion system protein L [Acinetobacter sp. ANC 3929]|uniref:type II secretion system protein GspL n=1 Tax=unclassified Acinetobacter TaxID=196816 RepID=UPI0002CE1975|nr:MULTISPECIES: type II secretion system protein GspL [unclassified Acinetobacter]ENW80837.1 type II secretion system protein L [Acinetobacter sp. ANC 3929]MCH7353486.1 type II secretion system protein GspL [Acinetobacter sp. NIPH 2023]MCH7354314.1 type II secretion system protein GspL [Acinetobacter sp. NIPH 1958]MCH7360785.1 type II secretion system protein GspL [Acinetobacter sp. NIPH 2024]